MSKIIRLWDTDDYYAINPAEQDILNKDCDDDWAEIAKCLATLLEQNSFVAQGSVGTWQGRVNGGLVIRTLREFESLLQDYNYIWLDGDGLHLKAIHHDGTNNIDFRVLNNRGEEYANNHEGYLREEVIPKLWRPAYSRNFNCYKKVLLTLPTARYEEVA